MTSPGVDARLTAPRTHRQVAHVMGMPISLALRGRHADDARAASAWHAALAVLREADDVFSTYRADSVVSRLDRGELALAECPDVVREVLELGERQRVESAGAFDVRRTGSDGTRHLDPSGVVKGWAVDRAARELARLPETDFCLSAGGDLVAHTASADSPAWRIGVEDPADRQGVLALVPVRRGAVATSGTAARGEHIVDARTGRPPSGVASVTVVGPDLTGADLDATAAFALGSEALTWLRGRPGRSGLVVWTDGTREVFGEQGPAV